MKAICGLAKRNWEPALAVFTARFAPMYMSGPSSQRGRTKVEKNTSVLLDMTIWSGAQTGLDIINIMGLSRG
jgi:hypothetical protein